MVIPEGIVTTGWPDVEKRCEEFGDTFDVWQSGVGRIVLGKRADGIYAATVGGVTLSIPRQVAKTFLVGRIAVALCTLYPGLRVIWTAHRTRTATNTFKSLQAVCKRKSVAGYVSNIRTANGEQEITFTNGSVIMFGAREQGFGRGFDEVDIEVFDEAQILTEKALEDMVAATNQSRHPHGALLFYMGTPPRPVDPGEAFAARRTEALAAKSAAGLDDFGPPVESGDAVFIECSADPTIGQPGGPSLDDEHQWRLANPSYPHRTPRRSMLRLRKNLTSDDAWRREGMGVWDRHGNRAVLDFAVWRSAEHPTAPAGAPAFAVRFSPDGARVSVAAAVCDELDDTVHTEVIATSPTTVGVESLADWLAERWRDSAGVVIDGKAGAGDLINALHRRKVPARVITAPTTDQVITAHAGFLNALRDGRTTHSPQPGVDAAVRTAGRRKIGTAGGWGWESISGDTDVTPLEATTLAHWLASTSRRKPGRSRASNGRRAVVT